MEVWLCLFLGCLLPVAFTAPDIDKASQCFKSRGIPKVAFTCPTDHMTKIHKAFHGIAVKDRDLLDVDQQCSQGPDEASSNCTFCQGDCIDESMNLVYDWSTCMGNTSCTRTVMQSYMPECLGPDKFSDYLQVEYQCIKRDTVIDICSDTGDRWMNDGYLMSPNYPSHYPVNQDCLCSLTTDANSKIILSFYDLLLETKKGRCRADWLMLRQNEQKHRHCGAIMTGTKNITSQSHSLELQFHSDLNNNMTQTFQYFTRVLKGFWLYFTAEPGASVQVNCRQLQKTEAKVQEILIDDSDYDEVVSTRGTDSTDKMVPLDTRPPTMATTPTGKAPNMDQGKPGKDTRDRNSQNEILDRETSVDYQGGRSGATTARQMISLLVIAAVLSCLTTQQ